MRYRHITASWKNLSDVAEKSGAVVGDDLVEHYLNKVIDKSWKLVGFAVKTNTIDQAYHFIFWDPTS